MVRLHYRPVRVTAAHCCRHLAELAPALEFAGSDARLQFLDAVGRSDADGVAVAPDQIEFAGNVRDGALELRDGQSIRTVCLCRDVNTLFEVGESRGSRIICFPLTLRERMELRL